MPEEKTPLTERDSRLDVFLVIAVTVAAVIVFVLLGYSLFFQIHTYKFGLEQALKNQESAVALMYARANDFAVTKTSTVFLGFVLAFVGALYVLRTARVQFTARATGIDKAGFSFQTSSPGLVMIALGVLTVILALYSKSYVSVDESGPSVRSSPEAAPSSPEAPNSPTRLKPAAFNLPPFARGSASLNEAQKSALSRLAHEMAVNPTMQFTIQAGADPDSSPEMAIALADRRAAAVKVFLASRIGAARIHTVSFGKEPSFDAIPRDSKVVFTPTN